MPTQGGPVAKGVGWSKYSRERQFSGYRRQRGQRHFESERSRRAGPDRVSISATLGQHAVGIADDVAASRSLAGKRDSAKSSDLAKAPDDADIVYFVESGDQ